MRVLAIETSCDETSIALVDSGRTIISMHTARQDDYHRVFGGVVPEIAARRHLEVFYPTLERCLAKVTRTNKGTTTKVTNSNKTSSTESTAATAKASNESIMPRSPTIPSQATVEVLRKTVDGIAVTTHPGLIGSLFVGVNAAKSLAYLLEKPLIEVSHLKAHFYSLVMTGKMTFPFLGLLVSGGHTILALVKTPLDMDILGATLDDACGECFDKIARALGLPYPGGAAIEKLALTGDADYFNYPVFRTHPRTHPATYRYPFSYSGLKTAVLYNSERYRNPQKNQQANPSPSKESREASSDHRLNPASLPQPRKPAIRPATLTNMPKAHIAASFQKAALMQLVHKTLAAAKETGMTQIGICGGVAANKYLQTLFEAQIKEQSSSASPTLSCVTPPLALCTDNAAMIGGIAYHYYRAGEVCEDVFALSPSAQSFKKDKIL